MTDSLAASPPGVRVTRSAGQERPARSFLNTIVLMPQKNISPQNIKDFLSAYCNMSIEYQYKINSDFSHRYRRNKVPVLGELEQFHGSVPILILLRH